MCLITYQDWFDFQLMNYFTSYKSIKFRILSIYDIVLSSPSKNCCDRLGLYIEQ